MEDDSEVNAVMMGSDGESECNGETKRIKVSLSSNEFNNNTNNNNNDDNNDQPRTVYLLVGCADYSILNTDYEHTMGVISMKSLCLANGIDSADIHTTNLTPLEDFLVFHAENGEKFQPKFCVQSQHPIPINYEKFDFSSNYATEIIQLFEMESFIEDGDRYCNKKGLLTVKPKDKLIVRFFGDNSFHKDQHTLEFLYDLFEFFSKIECEMILVDLCFSYSATLLKLYLERTGKLPSHIQVVAVDSSLVSNIHFSLYNAAFLIGLGNCDNCTTLSEWVNNLSQHFFELRTNSNKLTGSETGVLFCYPPNDENNLILKETALSFFGFNQSSTQSWLSKHFYTNYDQLKINFAIELHPSKTRFDTTDELFDYIKFRESCACTKLLSQYWRQLYKSVKAEIKYAMKHILPILSHELKLDLELLNSIKFSYSLFSSDLATNSFQQLVYVSQLGSSCWYSSLVKPYLISFKQRYDEKNAGIKRSDFNFEGSKILEKYSRDLFGKIEILSARVGNDPLYERELVLEKLAGYHTFSQDKVSKKYFQSSRLLVQAAVDLINNIVLLCRLELIKNNVNTENPIDNDLKTQYYGFISKLYQELSCNQDGILNIGSITDLNVSFSAFKQCVFKITSSWYYTERNKQTETQTSTQAITTSPPPL
eukprot:TRINITY_DN622_c0_g1_i5.p1 TRINITY_DN622_c0_g1~~TRINITY_DN622_c0_g1_i5.p1  ORF type:complete len:652 (-),score=147.24 TRINITY_DN622_c0_g1_i5:471-2426(-)